MSDTPFADFRHHRGDLRLMRTAIRRGWLNNAPQADRDALVARFEQAFDKRRTDDPAGQNLRALPGECYAIIEMERADQESLLGALWYFVGG